MSLNQAMATSSTSPPSNAYTIPSSASGVAYSVRWRPGARYAHPVLNASPTATGTAGDYCAPITAASGTVPWASFNTMCWAPATGTSLSAAPTAYKLEFEVTASATTAPFNFCVLSASFQ